MERYYDQQECHQSYRKKKEFLTTEIKRKDELLEEKSKKYNENLLEIEKKYDTKLATFQTANMKDFEGKLKITTETFDKKIQAMQTKIGEFKVSVQTQLNDFKTEKNQWLKHLMLMLGFIVNLAVKFLFVQKPVESILMEI